VANAFYNESRGLAQDSLASLLARQRGARYNRELPPHSVEQILAWAASYRLRTGRGPIHTSGAILEAPKETWSGVHEALWNGRRGLPCGSSLYRLLAEKRRLDRSARSVVKERVEVGAGR
jgi:hypothetical protein